MLVLALVAFVVKFFIELKPGSTKKVLELAMEKPILTERQLTGTYQRKQK